MADLIFILLFAVPFGGIFWALCIMLVMVAVDMGSTVVRDFKRNRKDRE